jgi:hypothetical protein
MSTTLCQTTDVFRHPERMVACVPDSRQGGGGSAVTHSKVLVQWSGPLVRRAPHNTTTPTDATIISQKVTGADPRSILPVRPIAMTPVFRAPAIARMTSAITPLASKVATTRYKTPLLSADAPYRGREVSPAMRERRSDQRYPTLSSHFRLAPQATSLRSGRADRWRDSGRGWHRAPRMQLAQQV